MTVFDFRQAQSLKQLKQNRAALVTVLDNIRSTLSRLFETKLVFHPVGSGAARMMLEAQEELSSVLDAIDAIADEEDPNSDKLRAIQKVLTRVGELTSEAAKKLRSIAPTNPS